MYDVYMEYCSDREGRSLAFTSRSTRASFQNPDINNSLVIEDIRAARWDFVDGTTISNSVEYR